ncbi:MAG: HD domain-containing protein [Eubacterium sp.]|nr:HD domain-containing protein [Eubacterium sp.]
MTLTSDAKRIIKLLLDNGYQAYAVGGCVRDNVLGVPVGDIDITTSARPEETEALLRANGIKYFETGLKHGTITAVVNREGYEITTFRSDGDYLDNRHPEEVIFVDDLRVDLSRRDFTMNALAYNDDEGFIDAFGGLEDIQNRLIRAVGDPERRFHEDALRIMRALRFASVLGFSVEERTKKALFTCKELLLNIAGERIFTELKKLLCGNYAEQVLMEYREILAVVIPELKPCFDFPQNSRWHIYDVYTHIVKTVVAAPKKDYLRFAALLHDVAKPQCKTTDSKGDHFFYHPHESALIAGKALSRFHVSNEFRYRVVTLIDIHDMHITHRPSNIKKWLRILGEDLIYDFVDLRIADLSTHNPDLVGEEIQKLQLVKTLITKIINSGEPYRISDMPINGKDLIEIGFTGREIQEELEKLIKIVSGNPECNKKEKLLLQARRDYEAKTEQ